LIVKGFFLLLLIGPIVCCCEIVHHKFAQNWENWNKKKEICLSKKLLKFKFDRNSNHESSSTHSQLIRKSDNT
jgi:hypothetical protein